MSITRIPNIMPAFTGQDAFAMLSDEHVNNFTVDYVRRLKRGRFEGGVKLGLRSIPINMQFSPGLNSPIDFQAGGFADMWRNNTCCVRVTTCTKAISLSWRRGYVWNM
jgi:hypothetical protein